VGVDAIARSGSHDLKLLPQCAGGVAAGLIFAVLLLTLNVGSLATLLTRSPESLPAFLIGAVLAFAPVVICTWMAIYAGESGAKG
jgi:hypothetical protein